MVEKWLPIAGSDGTYEVSDQGRVRSMKGIRVNPETGFKYTITKTKVLKLVRMDKRRTYLIVCVRINGKMVGRMVHTLVLETFIGPCPPGMQACHHPNMDGADNRVCNLRWDTPKANAADRTFHGRTAKGWKISASKTGTEVRWAMVDLYQKCDYSIEKITRIFGRDESTVEYIVTRPPDKRE